MNDRDFFMAVANRLEELGNGAEPKDESLGICWDIARTLREQGVDSTAVYEFLSEVWLEMGYEEQAFPLGEIDERHCNRYRRHWDGPRGDARRDLARRAAIVVRGIAPIEA